MAYSTNGFCWHGLVSTDVEKARAFYAEVIGWKVNTVDMGGDALTTFATADGHDRAHVGAPQMPGVPSHWDHYLRVDDVDVSHAKALAHGGAAILPPTDIPPGRFSVVTSPSGAVLCLFHEADEAASNDLPDIAGAFHWTELHSQDFAADLAWLRATFGFEVEDMDMPDGQKYAILTSGGQRRGGAMPAMGPEVPSMWLTWVEVDDADAAVARAVAHGGKGITPLMDMPGVGRMAIVSDDTGGVFGVIRPAPRG